MTAKLLLYSWHKCSTVHVLSGSSLHTYYKAALSQITHIKKMHTAFTCFLAMPGGNPILSVGDFMIT